MQPRDQLTAKEVQVATLVWEGLTNREIVFPITAKSPAFSRGSEIFDNSAAMRGCA